MKTGELRELSIEELKEREKNLQEELFNLKFQHGTNQLENSMRLRHTKKDVARVKTIMRQKELAAAGK
jgi:large subunit ribosomal protein L29